MFPEIVRDDVFRIESRRLWLRWPVAADAFDADATAASGLRAGPVGPGCRMPGTACVAAWRADAERGLAMHLVLEERSEGRPTVGTIHMTWTRDGSLAIDHHLAPHRRGEGLMAEAIQAVVRTVFLLKLATVVTVAPVAAERGGREVLERWGFGDLGSGRMGRAASDHLRLDRQTWLSLQSWGLPGQGPRLHLGVAPKDLDSAACA